ncbi:ABC transporter permease, partial [Xanthomonas citri pv. citri]|nr:ABC transporter permease [Xanthomonas citri pv. citri]
MKLRYLFILLIILAVTSVFIGVEDLSPLDLFDL